MITNSRVNDEIDPISGRKNNVTFIQTLQAKELEGIDELSAKSTGKSVKNCEIICCLKLQYNKMIFVLKEVL